LQPISRAARFASVSGSALPPRRRIGGVALAADDPAPLSPAARRRFARRRRHARHPDAPSLGMIVYGTFTENSVPKLFWPASSGPNHDRGVMRINWGSCQNPAGGCAHEAGDTVGEGVLRVVRCASFALLIAGSLAEFIAGGEGHRRRDNRMHSGHHSRRDVRQPYESRRGRGARNTSNFPGTSCS